MRHTLSRRTLIQTIGAISLMRSQHSSALAQATSPAYSYPMGFPGRALGDGLFVRIAYAAENARYYPGWWHTGENWHALEGGTAGLGVYAVAAGEVLFAGYDYPGLVIIVRHPDGLHSIYGHLDYTPAVAPGQTVERGQLLGTVLARADDLARSHLHFELRTFYTRPDINGTAPQYGVSCGYECPPGPGYWPMAAPEHPSQLGWRNPTHIINRRAWTAEGPDGAEVIVSESAPTSTPLWIAPPSATGAEPAGDLPLTPGARYPLWGIDSGAEDAVVTSAEATHLWYQIALPQGEEFWVQAAVPVAIDSGADDRPSSIRFDFLPALITPEE